MNDVIIMQMLFTESLDLSNYVHLSSVRPNMITFTWDPVVNTCPSLQYHIDTNCGILCPDNTTTDTTITCSRVTAISSNNCSFAVYASAMCGINTTVGTESSISLRLNGRI